MSNNFTDELARMQHLMNYGLNESSKKQGQATVEFHQKAADGKTYGILKECNKFYIKVAPEKETEILAEDYDYIGGIGNKKAFEYGSYAMASKQFDLKMQSINEAVNKEKRVLSEQYKPAEAAEWQVNETKEMRSELERFRQISNNVDYILSENKKGKVYEEAHKFGDPKGVTEKGGDPFQEKPDTTEKVNNMKENETNPQKADDTFKEKGEYKEEIKGNEHEDPKTADDTYDDKSVAGKIESEGTSVATEKGASHKNDKGVKMNESRTIVLTEEQVLAWNKSKDYMDTSKGTEIGATDPYTDKLSKEESNQGEVNEEFKTKDWDEGVPEGNGNTTGNVGSTEPFEKKVNETSIDPATGTPNTDISNNASFDSEFKGATPLEENKLDVFGKHPAYQKEPMTTPANKEIDTWGRDWNDNSAKGDKPFGTQIGHGGDPFSEKVVDMLTDAVMSAVKKKLS